MDEKVFYEKNNIKVTNSRFIVNDQTYALSSVNAVKVSVANVTTSYALPALLITAGATWLILLMILETTNPIFYIQSIALIAVGIYLTAKIKDKFEYSVMLTTSSGENAVLKSNEKQDIILVERALNDAIVYRG